MPKFNHALTICFEALSTQADEPTPEEALAGLLRRVAEILTADPDEVREILLTEAPFDTYEV